MRKAFVNERMGVFEAAATFGVAGGAGTNESAVLALWGGGGGGKWSTGPADSSGVNSSSAALSGSAARLASGGKRRDRAIVPGSGPLERPSSSRTSSKNRRNSEGVDCSGPTEIRVRLRSTRAGRVSGGATRVPGSATSIQGALGLGRSPKTHRERGGNAGLDRSHAFEVSAARPGSAGNARRVERPARASVGPWRRRKATGGLDRRARH